LFFVPRVPSETGDRLLADRLTALSSTDLAGRSNCDPPSMAGNAPAEIPDRPVAAIVVQAKAHSVRVP
jgi:hypothetical protein